MRVAAWIAGSVWFLTCASFSYARFARAAAPAIQYQPAALAPPPAPKPEPDPASAVTDAPTDPTESGTADNPAWDASADQPSEPAPGPVTPPPAPEPAAPPPSSILVQPAPASVTPATPASGPGMIASRLAATGFPSAFREKPKRSRSRKTVKSAVDREGEGTAPAFEPAARCLECGAPASSWVEVDGQRIGYCRKHYSKADRPRVSHKKSASTGETPTLATEEGGAAPAAAEAPASTRAEADVSTQCRGLTKDGTRCRRKTRDPSGYCYQHRPR